MASQFPPKEERVISNWPGSIVHQLYLGDAQPIFYINGPRSPVPTGHSDEVVALHTSRRGKKIQGPEAPRFLGPLVVTNKMDTLSQGGRNIFNTPINPYRLS